MYSAVYSGISLNAATNLEIPSGTQVSGVNFQGDVLSTIGYTPDVSNCNTECFYVPACVAAVFSSSDNSCSLWSGFVDSGAVAISDSNAVIIVKYNPQTAVGTSFVAPSFSSAATSASASSLNNNYVTATSTASTTNNQGTFASAISTTNNHGTVTSAVSTTNNQPTATETDANLNMNNGLNPTTLTQQSATATTPTGPNQDCITIKQAFPQVQFNVDCWNVGANSTYSVEKSQVHRRRGKKRDNQGHLVHVVLPRLGLSTSIPPELGDLGRTLIIDLSGNNIVGSIPPQLGQISDLIVLKLDGNSISGIIPPQLGNLHNLQTLELSRNQITGSIPVELAQLTNLHVFSIADNQLTGIIPPTLLTTLTNTGAVVNFGTNCLTDTASQRSSCATNKNLSVDKCHAVALDTNYQQPVYAPLWVAFANVNKDLNAFDKAAAASGHFAVPEYFFHAFRHYAGNLIWCMLHHPEFVYVTV
ncbi:UNVERIFIED_CONTAM: hypothetical protein HDU68_005403 [Siphonaria sp. JEL0065]|nr:hypothetical protein HDU68_005403 [Siphonaria sp. JEL0065]